LIPFTVLKDGFTLPSRCAVHRHVTTVFDMPRPDGHLPIVENMLRAAGAQATRWFGRTSAEHKVDGSPVTIADRASEAVLVEHLQAAYPQDGIRGEEGTHIDGGPHVWVVDPIDGTSAFLEGLAHWGPSVARLYGSRVCIGGVFLPRLDELYFFEHGGPAIGNGVILNPMSQLPPTFEQPDPVLYIPSKLHSYVEHVAWKGKCRCLGSVAAHLCLVARGSAAATLVQPGWRIWDTAAGLGLIRAVGGEACRLDGAPIDVVADEGIPFVAGRPEAVRWLTTPGRIIPRSRLD
jgi:fructose-1,6-bisphosphatase/inositol monophosphatase family enzyme